MHALNLAARSTAFRGALLVVLGAALAACPGGGAETTEDLITSTTTTTNNTSGAMTDTTGSTTGTSTGGDGPTTTLGPTTDPGTTSAATMETTSGTSTGEQTTGSSGDSTTGEPPENMLSVVPLVCLDNGVTNPILPEEAGHYAATTLTPNVYPFTVERVRYNIRGPGYKPSCSTAIAHEVQVYVTQESKPPPKPSETAASFVTIAMPAEAMTEEFRVIDLPLAQPIVLNEGDRLVVAVEMAAAADLKTGVCIRSCYDFAVANVDWWSNVADEPFAWSDLVVDYGFEANLTIQAIGTPG